MLSPQATSLAEEEGLEVALVLHAPQLMLQLALVDIGEEGTVTFTRS